MTEIIALVCGHVFRNEREVKLVIRHSDGGWQLACGEYDHPEDYGDAEFVGINHLLERQPNLASIGELKPGYLAEKSGEGWMSSAHDD